jgi:hypothetical protein
MWRNTIRAENTLDLGGILAPKIISPTQTLKKKAS